MVETRRMQDAVLQELVLRSSLSTSESDSAPSSPEQRDGCAGWRHRTHSDKKCIDENGLIVPRKLHYPHAESREANELSKEMRWNAKVGINVLDKKSELDKALERRRWQRVEAEKKTEAEAAKTDLQKAMEERARRSRLTEVEKSGGETDSVSFAMPSSTAEDANCNEIQKARATLRHMAAGGGLAGVPVTTAATRKT